MTNTEPKPRKRVLVPRDLRSVDDAARRKILTVPGQDKRLQIVPVPNSGLFQIKYTGGGETPTPLKGNYTSMQNAEKAIARWLA